MRIDLDTDLETLVLHREYRVERSSLRLCDHLHGRTAWAACGCQQLDAGCDGNRKQLNLDSITLRVMSLALSDQTAGTVKTNCCW